MVIAIGIVIVPFIIVIVAFVILKNSSTRLSNSIRFVSLLHRQAGPCKKN
jgi:uncharacterized membrane protein YkvI